LAVVIVTGGTYGIGAGISLTLAARGHDVIAFGLDSRQPSSVAADGTKLLLKEARARGLELTTMEADVSETADVERVIDAALAKFGRVDALVNNAAIGPLGTILDHSEELWDRVLAVNLKGPFLCCKAALPHMIAAGGGSIVNIGSGSGWGKPNMFAYAASKGGLLAFSASLAYDFFQQHIRVNTVIPGGGGIFTGMSYGRREGEPTGPMPASIGTAAGRPATPEDIGNAVAFLLSPEAAVLSGTVIDVGCFAMQGGPIPKGAR
jgi:NAD(P)-dependent dehydrogenase (short-subunit alcohol dehydrogenase family)